MICYKLYFLEVESAGKAAKSNHEFGFWRGPSSPAGSSLIVNSLVPAWLRFSYSSYGLKGSYNVKGAGLQWLSGQRRHQHRRTWYLAACSCSSGGWWICAIMIRARQSPVEEPKTTYMPDSLHLLWSSAVAFRRVFNNVLA